MTKFMSIITFLLLAFALSSNSAVAKSKHKHKKYHFSKKSKKYQSKKIKRRHNRLHRLFKRIAADDPQCDVVEDNKKGLFGLCVAYCIAHKGPTELPTDGSLSTLSRAERWLLKKYNKRMREGDPSMPCINTSEPVSCPAWSQAELEDIGTHGFVVTELEDDIAQVYYDSESSLFNGSVKALVNFNNGSLEASYFHSTNSDVENNTDGIRTVTLTQEEFDTCKQQLLDYQASEQ